MSTIKITQAHRLTGEDAKSKLGAFESDIAKYGMRLDWKGNRADLKGTGASGAVDVTSSAVSVEVKLGMMAKMAGVKPDLLEKSIQKRLKSALVGED